MGKRKGKKSYYKSVKGSKRGRYETVLQGGMKGFLITCGNKAEGDAIRDAYNLLNEYADKFYGPEEIKVKGDESDESGSEEEEDIEKALKKEVQTMKKKKTAPRRFQAAETGANNCVFIRTTLDNPFQLLSHIITELDNTKVAKSRHIMKMFPVISTCRSDPEKIKSTATQSFKAHFKDVESFTYCCNFKIRNNTGMSRGKILPLMCDVFSALESKTTVDFNNPEYIISVDIIKSVCCFSVLKDFQRYRKYNLQEIVAVRDKSVTNQVQSGVECDYNDASDKEGVTVDNKSTGQNPEKNGNINNDIESDADSSEMDSDDDVDEDDELNTVSKSVLIGIDNKDKSNKNDVSEDSFLTCDDDSPLVKKSVQKTKKKDHEREALNASDDDDDEEDEDEEEDGKEEDDDEEDGQDEDQENDDEDEEDE